MVKNSDQGGGIEKRGRTFYVAGHLLAAGIAVAFVVTLGTVFAVGEFWRSWLYKGTVDLSDACAVSAEYSGPETPTTNPAMRPIKIPHRGSKLDIAGEPTSLVRLKYRCQVPDANTAEMGYVHWGWLSGQDVQVKVDGRVMTRFSGSNKFITPFNGKSLVEVEIVQAANAVGLAGFIGVQTPVVAVGFPANNKLFGIDSFLFITRAISYLIPIVSLGLVLGLAWFGGFRSRTVSMAMYVMTWAVLQRAISLATGMFGLSFGSDGYIALSKVGFGISIIMFHMEVVRLFPKAIYSIGRVTTTLLVAVGVIYFLSGSPVVLEFASISLNLVISTAMLATAGALVRRKGLENRVVLVTSAICGIIYALDAYARASGLPIYMANQLQLILPLYVAIFLQSSLAFSDKKFWKERRQNEALTEIVDLESARVSTLSRFLPKTLVDQFATLESIDQSLSRVLSPRAANVAVIQADMRGFSRLLSGRPEAEVIRLMQTCFGPVVDYAQKFAMVKLVGDCLFAFVEEGEVNGNPVDRAIEVAAHLIRQVQEVNGREGFEDGLRFGIAITYGRAVVGNLSADSCIDYTAIGEPVNLAARLEELTKDERMTRLVGRNGVIMSSEAVAARSRFALLPAGVVELSWTKVRSFDRITQISFLSEQDCLNAVFQRSMVETSPSSARAGSKTLLNVA